MPASERVTVSRHVRSAAWRALLLLAPLILSIGCQVEPRYVLLNDADVSGARYTRYTLRGVRPQKADRPWILHRSNYLSDPVLFPPGRKVTIRSYSDVRIELDIEDDSGVPRRCEMRSGKYPFPLDPTGIQRFFEKHFTRDPAEVDLSKLGIVARTYIEEGRYAGGMTREQVLMALGYPSHVNEPRIPAVELDRGRILECDIWWYRKTEIADVIPVWKKITFGSGGTVDIRAD